MSGYEVLLHDLKDEYVEKGLGTIAKNLSRQVEKGKMESEEKDANPFPAYFLNEFEKCS